MNSLKNKNVLIVGLGKSGIAAAKFAAERGAKVTVTDIRSESELKKELKALKDVKMATQFGNHGEELFEKTDFVIVSPGVPVDIPGIVRVTNRGIPVVNEMELALREISTPVIAVTGTNGKTTTTELIGHLLENSGIKRCVAGNIGTPLVSIVDEANAADWLVLEVSSFQLETMESLKPAVAVWLNATPDHLDRHESFESYVDLKAKLFTPLTNESWGIYNAADEIVRDAVLPSKATLVPFDATGTRKDGGWYESGDLWADVGSRGRFRFDLRHVILEGCHNRENMLGAILAVLIAGGTHDAIQGGLESFRGLPHRLEFVAEVNGVRFYDDSKATNVGATVRALDAFAEPVVLIAGGQDKGSDFTQLRTWIKEGVKRLVLIGQAADTIQNAIGAATETVRAKTLDEAVKTAWDSSDPGDVVLLSPACASFDMFRDYAARGDAFKDSVKTITKRRRKRTR